MKLMKKIAVVFCVLGLLASTGCSEHEAVGEINAVVDKICDCKKDDAKCLMEGGEAMIEVATKHKDAEITQGDQKKIDEAIARGQACTK
jgi:hypothetical protein